MSVRIAAAGVILLSLAASAAQHPAAAAGPQRVRSHCVSGELTIYNCDYGAQVLSVCDNHGRFSYRYGPAGHPDLTITSTGADGRLHAAETTGVGGASQVQMRFTRGAYNYIVFGGDALPYREGGPSHSGVAITRAGRLVSTRVCPDRLPGLTIDYPDSIVIDGADQEMLPWR